MKFVAFQADYSDENRAYGFALMTTEQWNEYQAMVKSGSTVSWMELVYSETPEDFLQWFEVSEITKEENDSIVRIFNISEVSKNVYQSWGMFPHDPYVAPDEEITVDEW